MSAASVWALIGLLILQAPAAWSAQVPRPAPDYTIQLLDGKTLPLKQYRGKVVVLEFLLTHCPGCMKAAGALERLQKEFGTEKVQMLGVAFDELARQKLGEFRTKSGARFPIGIDQPLNVHNFLQHSTMLSLMTPVVVVIDKRGNIRAQHLGTDRAFFANEEANLRAMIRTLMAEK